MSAAYEYTALITSLPSIKHWSTVKRPPISLYQLEKRFQVLNPIDAGDIDILVSLLDWSNQALAKTDQEYSAECNALLARVVSIRLRDMIVWRLEFRSIVAALRHKRAGHQITSLTDWGFGSRVKYISDHWQDQYLGLSRHFPWVVALVDSMSQGHPLNAEKIIINELWRWLESMSLGHQFDLEAVAIYRMRWEIVNNWTKSSREGQQEITFEKIMNQALSVAAVHSSPAT